MRAGRTQSVTALIVAAAALLVACVFGFLSFLPGVDPAVGAFLQLGFFGGAVVTLGASVMYIVASRRASSGAPGSRFDRLLDHRAAALGAVPVGLAAVGVGVLWYAVKTMSGGAGAPAIDAPGPNPFAAIDTAGIAAFLGFGTLYVVVAVVLAIRAERQAIRVAREEAEVSVS